MKYILKTEINSKGNNVFCKERNGKAFTYYAKDDLNNICKVDKKWILKNRIDILNLGVSYDRNIYPATDLRQRKRLPDDMVRCDSCGEVVWESNSYTFHKNGTNDDIIICDNCNEWGHDGYVSCHTCSIPCWVKADKLAEIVGSRNENYVCKEWMECYEYCEGCDVYYNSDHEVCPRCGE